MRTEQRRRTDRASGTLVLIGGACSARGPALGAFIERAGGREGGRIVGLTTASADPLGSALAWKNDFAAAGVRNIEFPIVDRRDRAQDARIARMVAEARGVFLGGGDQVHLVATLAGSRVGDALREAFMRGAVVGGTSAGAAALTATIMAGGEVDDDGGVVPLHIGPGFGLLDFRAMIDTHFAQRRRLSRLFHAIARNPDLMGLGLDEDTALVVRGHLGAVAGAGGVTFVDGRSVRYTNAEEITRDEELTLSHLRVGIVGSGQVFNLRERELEVLLQAERAPEETPSVKGDDAP